MEGFSAVYVGALFTHALSDLKDLSQAGQYRSS